MKKMLAMVICFSLLFAGCATVKVEAPRGQKMVLQPSVESQPLIMKKKVWYVIWGLVPISPNSTAEMVKDEKLTEMSCKQYTGFDDFLISYFLGILTLSTRSVEIRGK